MEFDGRLSVLVRVLQSIPFVSAVDDRQTEEIPVSKPRFLTRDRLRTSSSGFSLAELLVVVAIMGLLVGVSVPAFMNFLRAFRLKSSGRQVVGDMQLARQRAITRSRDYYVFFETDLNSHTINRYRIVESNLQNGILVAGATSVNFKGPVGVAEFVHIVTENADTEKPAGATVAAFPSEALTGFTTLPAVVFFPSGAAKTTGAVWVAIDPKSGPRYTWMEVSSNSVGKVGAQLGP